MKKIYLLLILAIVAADIFAQAPPPTPGPSAPIADNLILLLLAGIGFGVTAVFAHGAFESRSKNLLYINAGNRIVTILVMGLIISAFLK